MRVNKLIKLLLILIGLFAVTETKAQEESREAIQQRLDSVQRIRMKDSLQVTDAKIDSVWQVRNQYWASVTAVYADTSLSTEQKSTQLEALKLQTNYAIKAILRETVYNRYTSIIAEKARKRGATSHAPLAGSTGN